MSYVEHNRATIDGWVRGGWEWSLPVSHEDYLRAQAGDFRLLLTPTRPVPARWLGDLKGKSVLPSSGGGQQGLLLTAPGARSRCSISPRPSWRATGVAEREGYHIGSSRAT